MAMVIQAPGAWVQVLSHIRSIFGTHHRGKGWFHAIDPPATMPQRGGQEKDTAQGLVIRHEHFLGKRRLGCAYDFQDLAEHLSPREKGSTLHIYCMSAALSERRYMGAV